MAKKMITRNNEMVLLSILRLGDNAYLVSILDLLNQTSGKSWTIGNLFVALEKLEEAGHISARLGKPKKIKGGRAIKYFTVTQTGVEALRLLRTTQDKLWQGLYEKVFK